MVAESPEVVLTHRCLDRQGNVSLTLTCGAATPFVDRVCIAKAGARAKCAEGLVAKFPGLDRDMIEQRLAEVAAAVERELSVSHVSDDDVSATDRLVAIACNEELVELFHSPGEEDSRAFATVKVGDVRKTWPVDSKSFRHWITNEYLTREDKAPPAQAKLDAIATITAKAVHQSPEHAINVRVARHNGLVYVDLADEHWRVVEISKSGYRILQPGDSPVRFVRFPGMEALPTPEPGGNVMDIGGFVNLPTRDEVVLFVCFLAACLWPEGPYPILLVTGEKGSAKSTLCRFARKAIDPNKSPLRLLPKTEQDLMIAAERSRVPCFENISSISEAISNALCVVTTGGGYGTRELYTTGDERIFDVQRPVMLNGIGQIVVRSDLLDRCLVLRMPPIPTGKRRDEQSLLAEFDAVRPQLLGALFGAISSAMAFIDDVHLTWSPRLADFARFAVAMEKSVGWPPGTVERVLRANERVLVDAALDAEPVGAALIELTERAGEWFGTATQLVKQIAALAKESGADRDPAFPKSADALGRAIGRITSDLRQAGVLVSTSRSKDRKRQRLITLRRLTCEDDEGSGAEGADGAPAQGRGVQKCPAKKRPGATAKGDLDTTDTSDTSSPTFLHGAGSAPLKGDGGSATAVSALETGTRPCPEVRQEVSEVSEVSAPADFGPWRGQEGQSAADTFPPISGHQPSGDSSDVADATPNPAQREGSTSSAVGAPKRQRSSRRSDAGGAA